MVELDQLNEFWDQYIQILKSGFIGLKRRKIKRKVIQTITVIVMLIIRLKEIEKKRQEIYIISYLILLYIFNY